METTPLARWDVYNPACPTRRVLSRIADKWTVLIIGSLAAGTRRFGELRREIGASQKVLSQTLRALERDGLVTRRVYASVPPKVEYSLTPLARTLIDVVDEVRVWAESHIETVMAAQRAYDEQTTAPPPVAADAPSADAPSADAPLVHPKRADAPAADARAASAL
jgi:DNA-binding HxlR family transcriptional regulator